MKKIHHIGTIKESDLRKKVRKVMAKPGYSIKDKSKYDRKSWNDNIHKFLEDKE